MTTDAVDLVFVDAPAFVAFVAGRPAPGGSKTPGRTRWGKMFLRPASKYTKGWMAAVRAEALRVMVGPPLTGPVELRIAFTLARPKSHCFAGRRAGVLRPDAPVWHVHAPDATKLFRSTEDALKGIVFADDGQVVRQSATKEYGARPGAMIVARRIDESSER